MSTTTTPPPPIPGPIGFGLMNLTLHDPPLPDSTLFPILSTALSSGATFWNTGTFYNLPHTPHANLHLIARFLAANPAAIPLITLSVKSCVNRETFSFSNSREAIESELKVCKEILGAVGKTVDVFQCARVVRDVPIEQTIQILKEFVEKGEIRGIGLSEAGPDTIRRAAKIHPIAAVEVEASLWSQEIFETHGVAETCAELGIPVVAYSPLGRGFLTKRYNSPKDIPAGDFRHQFDRFAEEVWERNRGIVERVERVSKETGATMAQVVLGWVRWRAGKVGGLQLVPIPGASEVGRVRENCEVRELEEGVYEGLDAFMRETEVVGGRYNDWMKDQLLV